MLCLEGAFYGRTLLGFLLDGTRKRETSFAGTSSFIKQHCYAWFGERYCAHP